MMRLTLLGANGNHVYVNERRVAAVLVEKNKPTQVVLHAGSPAIVYSVQETPDQVLDALRLVLGDRVPFPLRKSNENVG